MVRLVPRLKVPPRHLLLPVPLHKVPRHLRHHLPPQDNLHGVTEVREDSSWVPHELEARGHPPAPEPVDEAVQRGKVEFFRVRFERQQLQHPVHPDLSEPAPAGEGAEEGQVGVHRVGQKVVCRIWKEIVFFFKKKKRFSLFPQSNAILVALL